MRAEIEQWFRKFQQELCRALEENDGGATFQEDPWTREGGGGGYSRVIENGNVFEKGGVNFSAVHGTMPAPAAKALELPDPAFFATGVSVVLHPLNPLVPITHMNVRYFEAGSGQAWFGGGIDLTPIYVDREQTRFFHRQLKEVCDRHHPDYYPLFKDWADNYFFIPHRQETRGVGGIFFDRLTASPAADLPALFRFVQDVARAFAPTYLAIVKENKDLPYLDHQVAWQRIRRGRYVEFNLVYDRGTKFGLETGGRTESILMSLPTHASWVYNHTPEPGSEEEETLAYLKKEIDWVREEA
jgi:coproporphyrinogen III oxidase